MNRPRPPGLPSTPVNVTRSEVDSSKWGFYKRSIEIKWLFRSKCPDPVGNLDFLFALGHIKDNAARPRDFKRLFDTFGLYSFNRHHYPISTPAIAHTSTRPKFYDASIQGRRQGQLQTCWWYGTPKRLQLIYNSGHMLTIITGAHSKTNTSIGVIRETMTGRSSASDNEPRYKIENMNTHKSSSVKEGSIEGPAE